ncbi:MAG TPA: type II secretion system protein GspL, partial [Ramlibacter sp.]|nr:type II secretion system protein GspL [Ramlibacter sp.]
MRSLFVQLPLHAATASTEFAYLLSGDGRHVDQQGSAPAALLPLPTGAGAQVIAIAPAKALSWHRVELPRGTSASAPRLRAVLEGLLEDRLLDEPEAIHFAVEPGAQAGTSVWVAVCERAWLRSAVQLLEAAQRPVSRIAPEFAPEGALVLKALGQGEDATLVAASSEGVLLVPLAPASAPLLASFPDDTPVVAEPAAAALAEQLLKRPVVLQHPAERWLQSAQSSWDLAQLDFASSGRARRLKKLASGWADVLHAPHWRPARWAAGLLVALNLVGLNAWAWKEHAALEAKRDALRSTLTSTFPQVKVVVDAPVQMEKEVGALRQATGTVSGR